MTFEFTNSGSIGCDHGFIHVGDRWCRQIMFASSSRRDWLVRLLSPSSLFRHIIVLNSQRDQHKITKIRKVSGYWELVCSTSHVFVLTAFLSLLIYTVYNMRVSNTGIYTAIITKEKLDYPDHVLFLTYLEFPNIYCL